MKKKLIGHFGEVISITDICGNPGIVTIRDTTRSIIQEFYRQPKENQEDGSSAIIKAVAKLLKSEIKSISASKTLFPAASDMFSIEHNLEYIPNNLQTFLRLLFSEKDCHLKVTSIGQATVQETRPRVLQPPLQLGLGVHLHHQSASKVLINICHSLGFRSSYAEIQKFEASAAACLGTFINGILPGSCIQFVADNVDHNVRNLDGNNSFDGIGIIAGVTPGMYTSQPILCVNVAPDYLKLLGNIEITSYRQPINSIASTSFPKLRAMDGADLAVRLDVFLNTILTLNLSMPRWAGCRWFLENQ